MTKLKISFSRISDYDRNGASALIDKKQSYSIALNKGSLINDLLFENVDFNEKYTMKNYERPTATALKLANIIIDNFVSIPSNEEIIELIRANSFWKTTKDENLINQFDKPEFWEYLNQQMNIDDKIPVTPSMKLEADEIVNILKNHPNSKKLFTDKDIELHSEVSFEIDYRKVILRGIVDIIEVNHKNKTVRVIDLKTGGDDALGFESSFVKWRYYLQEAVYMKAIDHIKEQLEISDYATLPFQFLYIGLREKIPVIYNVSDKWHNAALNGFKTASGYTYKGLEQLIDEIEYLWYNKVFDIPYEIYTNKGNLLLNDSFISVNENV